MSDFWLGISIVVAVVLVVFWIGLSQRGKNVRSDRLCKLFRLPSDEYELLGSDLGGGKDKVYLRADGLVGVSDAMFRHKKTASIVVGEAKRRRVGRNGPSKYEKYQVILYIGMAERKYRRSVRGILRYGCGSVIQVDADPETYRWLLSLLPAYRKVAKKVGLDRGGRRRRFKAAA